MSRARLNLFIQPEHAKRLNELAITKGVSKPSIIAARKHSQRARRSGAPESVLSMFPSLIRAGRCAAARPLRSRLGTA